MFCTKFSFYMIMITIHLIQDLPKTVLQLQVLGTVLWWVTVYVYRTVLIQMYGVLQYRPIMSITFWSGFDEVNSTYYWWIYPPWFPFCVLDDTSISKILMWRVEKILKKNLEHGNHFVYTRVRHIKYCVQVSVILRTHLSRTVVSTHTHTHTHTQTFSLSLHALTPTATQH